MAFTNGFGISRFGTSPWGSGEQESLIERGASADITFTATSGGTLVVPAPAFGVTRRFWGQSEELVPIEVAALGFSSDDTVDNRVEIIDEHTLNIVGTYSGPVYTLAGPPDADSSPIQLGFKKWDKIRLIGPTGSEPNHGREFTLDDPSVPTVIESLDTPDAAEYDFIVYRRPL